MMKKPKTIFSCEFNIYRVVDLLFFKNCYNLKIICHRMIKTDYLNIF